MRLRSASACHLLGRVPRTVSDPAFWQKLHALCVAEFTYEDDADSAWENFLIGMKGRLSAGEAARIRDVVGVRGES